MQLGVGDPAEVILQNSIRSKPSLITMAARGRAGLGKWYLGSTAERVLRNATRPLLLVCPTLLDHRSRKGAGLRRILVPQDGSEHATAILTLVKEIAAGDDPEIVFLHVPPGETGSFSRRDGARRLASGRLPPRVAALRERMRAEGLRARVRIGSQPPAVEILAAVEEEEIDLVALTSHGSRRVSRWPLGAVAEKVARNCPVHLLLHRSPREAGRSEGLHLPRAAREAR
jgi:nucleotide-binding universal stress UspA family protein